MENLSITKILARQILDSRGNPTVEADVYLENGAMGRAAVPSGASTGSKEAIELRDGDDRFGGKGVFNAVNNIKEKITPAIIGKNVFDQRGLDDLMIEIDGTDNKANLGANAILAVSLAAAKAAAQAKLIPLHEYIAEIADTKDEQSLPLPMMNVMNGGKHAAGSTDIQEFLIIPKSANTIQEAIETGANIFHNLAKILKENDYMTTVGDEGGYAPKIRNGNSEPLNHIVHAIEKSGLTPGEHVGIGLDVAASEFYSDGKYDLKTENKILNSDEMVAWIEDLKNHFPLISIEDGLDENDWNSWIKLNSQLGNQIQLVGDDLLVTNTKILAHAIEVDAANSILIKPNQIGSLSETIDAVKMAKKANWRTIISHRSGETEDTTIAHIAVGLGAGQIKTGSMSRTDRVSKYNELLRISENRPNLKLARPFGSV